MYFTGSGINPTKDEDKLHATAIVAHLKMLELPVTRVAWAMVELILDCDDPEKEFDPMRKAVAVQAGMSEVFVDSEPDADIKLDEFFTHHMRIGPSQDEALIIGSTTDKFKKAWEELKACYLEVHLWCVARDGKSEKSVFTWTVLRPEQGFNVVAMNPTPVLVPIDRSKGYVCRYAEKMGDLPKGE